MLQSYSGICMHEKINAMKIKIFADTHLHNFLCHIFSRSLDVSDCFFMCITLSFEPARRFGSGFLQYFVHLNINFYQDIKKFYAIATFCPLVVDRFNVD